MHELMVAVTPEGGFRGIEASGVKLDTTFGVGQVMPNLSSRLKPLLVGSLDQSFMGFD